MHRPRETEGKRHIDRQNGIEMYRLADHKDTVHKRILLVYP